MKTANQAFIESTKALNEEDSLQMQKVESLIEEAIKNRKYSCSGYDSLNESVINRLKELGYKVTTSFHRNESVYEIKWAN